jgi:signal transduction histidine kinase
MISNEDPGASVSLRDHLAARMAPLAMLLVIVVTVAAPVAFYVVGLRTLRIQAAASARQVAQVIGREAQQRPVLWKYDTIKLLPHLRSYEMQESIESIDVVDPSGALIEPHRIEASEALARAAVIWQLAPIVVDGDPVGTVWVAASTRGVRTGALLMLIPFGLLGVALAGLMYWLPLRALRRAEASELARAYRELQRKEQSLRELTSRTVGMQEAERRAIARELHDSAGQAMTAIRLNLQVLCGRSPAEGEHGLAELIDRTTALVDDALEEVRRAVHRLGPSILDDVGIADALARACEDLGDRTGVEVDSKLELPADGLPPAVEVTCYRVVQEALTNVARHAEATHVKVRLAADHGHARVEVVDDGRGFESQAERSNVRGLTGMRERVELLGGSLEVGSAPGQGTRISAVIPLGR